MPRAPRPLPLETTSPGKATALLLLRVFLMVLIVVVAALFILKVNQDAGRPAKAGEAPPPPPITGWSVALPIGVALALGAIVLLADVLTPRKKLSTLSGVFLGLLAGLLASVAISFLIDLGAQGYELEKSPIIPTLKILLSVSLCYLAVSVVLQTQDDFRLVIPYVEFSKQIRGVRPLMLDTSALVDGRILEIAQSGLLQAPIIIPRFVIGELNALADSSDRLKRAKGRRGLDLVSRLQRSTRLEVSISESHPSVKGVDQMLVEQARIDDAVILTTDSALTRVAEIHDVRVISLNALAAALRPGVVAGESIVLRIVKPGEQPGQGVGFLDDGTMVVVENGADLIGQERALTVTGSLQTSAGRLVFARATADLPMDPDGAADAADTAERPARAGREAEATAAQVEPAHGGSARAPTPADGPGPPVRADTRRASIRNPRR